jgi:hypothetical protein
VIRNLGILLCILGMPSFVSARGNQAVWENLNTLQPGQKIQILEMTSKIHSGTFLYVSGTAISLEEKDGEQTIQRQDVRIVKFSKRARHLRNALIVGAAGAGVGAGIGAAAYHPCKTPPQAAVQCLILAAGVSTPRLAEQSASWVARSSVPCCPPAIPFTTPQRINA